MKSKDLLIGVLIVVPILLFFGFTPRHMFYPGSFDSGWGMMGNRDQIRFRRDQTQNFYSEEIEKRFIEEMVPHHEGAIKMAELVLEKSERPEMLILAKDIIEAQTREIILMKGWYKEWFGEELETRSEEEYLERGRGYMMHMFGDLEELANATDFDLEFIRQMIPHHHMAIMMSQALLAETDQGEMKELARGIISSQSREIEMMQGWYSDWTN